MNLLRLCLLPFALLAFSNVGCNGGDLGPGGSHDESDATHEEDMAGMDMAVPNDSEAAETAAEVGPTAADSHDMAGMDMAAPDTTTAPDTSMAGMEM